MTSGPGYPILRVRLRIMAGRDKAGVDYGAPDPRVGSTRDNEEKFIENSKRFDNNFLQEEWNERDSGGIKEASS